MLKKWLISAFVTLNIATVLYMNRPAGPQPPAPGAPGTSPPAPVSLPGVVGLADKLYAHLTGLDNRWQMFGALPRINWWFLIKAEYADGTTVVLPLPLQSERTFWQRALFDFKEMKFHNNIYNEAPGRRAYASYLSRQYPSHEGAPIKAIIWELHGQKIRPPWVAAAQGSHLEPRTVSRVLDVFPCR
jgi:hypothetical protein